MQRSALSLLLHIATSLIVFAIIKTFVWWGYGQVCDFADHNSVRYVETTQHGGLSRREAVCRPCQGDFCAKGTLAQREPLAKWTRSSRRARKREGASRRAPTRRATQFFSSQQQHLSQGTAIVLPKMCVNHPVNFQKRYCVQKNLILCI